MRYSTTSSLLRIFMRKQECICEKTSPYDYKKEHKKANNSSYGTLLSPLRFLRERTWYLCIGRRWHLLRRCSKTDWRCSRASRERRR